MVAPPPARAYARVPARVLGALACGGGRKRRLLALPPLRPPRLGVLRDCLAGLVAKPAREREPHPQGALPAPARSSLDRGNQPRLVRRDARRRRRAQPLAGSGGAGDGLARVPARSVVRVHRCRVRADGRGAERPLPGRRALAASAPLAVVLPAAAPLQTRPAPRRGRLPGCRVRTALAELPHAP